VHHDASNAGDVAAARREARARRRLQRPRGHDDDGREARGGGEAGAGAPERRAFALTSTRSPPLSLARLVAPIAMRSSLSSLSESIRALLYPR
jgi:hypothetical protein